MYNNTDKYITPETSKVQVAQNSCYELHYDESSNRISLIVNGYWKDKEAVPEYLKDWQKVLRLSHSNFTVLSDLRTMITHPPSLNSLHLEVQNLIKEHEVLRMALLEPADRIATLQIHQIINQCGMPLNSFTSLQEAEAWLEDAD